MKSYISIRTLTLIGFIILAAGYRLYLTTDSLSAIAGFTPIGAIALFAGCYFQNRIKAFLIPLVILWISDLCLNRFIYFGEWVFFYEGFYWVYSSFFIMVLIGRFINKVSIKHVLLAAIAGAVSHWIISDIGVWLGAGTDITTGLPFTQDLSGFLTCLYVALPFMKNMMIGNILYCAILFGSFEWIQRRYPILQLSSVSRA
jgi:hypothetical protein